MVEIDNRHAPMHLLLRLAAWIVACLLGAATGLGAERAGQDFAAFSARTSPEWLTRGVIYQVWLRSFTPEGTLKAATKRLPDVADLGATILYLSPVQLQDTDMRREFWSTRQKQSATNNPRNPYRPKDYDRIDPEFGTEADLREFVDVAHKLGLRVLLDVIYHHTGPTCVLLEQPDFYLRDASGKPLVNQWNFLRLNLESPKLREYLIGNMLHWVKDCGLDGFRCDVSVAVPLDFWEEARARLEAVRPDLVLLAENGDPGADQVKAFDIDDSRWRDACVAVVTQGEPATTLRRYWETTRNTFPRGARFIRYSDHHHMQRADVVFGERGVQAVSVLNFTLDGVPFLYNGQEIGDATPQDLFAHWPIRWEAATLPTAVQKRQFYQKLCQLRCSERALAAGDVVWLTNDQSESVLSYLRRTDHAEILVVVNLSNRALKVRVTMPDKASAAYRNLLTQKVAVSTAEGLTVGLAGFDYLVGKRLGRAE